MNLKQKCGIALSALLLSISFAASAQAESAKEQKVKEAFAKNAEIKEGVDYTVKATKYADLYEIELGGKIVYTDESGRYLIMGVIYDTKTKVNLTKARLAEIGKIDFSTLPLNLALKRVKGNGERVIAVFSDPNCSHCKTLEKTLEKVDNITIYTFMYSILSKDSRVKSHNIWCSSNPNQAWEDWMLKGKVPATAAADCEDKIPSIYFAGKNFKVEGTPNIFLSNGLRIAGAPSGEHLEKALSEIK